MAPFEYRQAQEIQRVFAEYGVSYLCSGFPILPKTRLFRLSTSLDLG